MAVKLTTTSHLTKFVKCIVYGPTGVGKTKLAETCPTPLIISSEKKMLSLKDSKIPVALIENHEDLEEILEKLKTDKKFSKFETIILDSVSDIAETILDYFKKNPLDNNPHPQAAYGSLNDVIIPLIKGFRDLPGKHLYVIAKSKRMDDEVSGVATFAPMMPGQVLPQSLPYLFDFVFAMRIGETSKGKKYRYLQTEACLQWSAKGTDELNAIEEPHLGKLFNKVLGVKKETEKEEESQK